MQRLTSNPIQELRRILNDQYSFGSIIKELIQNADDARAREFHLAWVPRWPSGTHPLLTGPALLCLNDGEFRKADAKAICRLDEGAKGTDPGTIGKYGLGMKSVFHLCEGFFYAASADQPAADGRLFVELLNPWPEGGPHDSWVDTDRARREIIERIRTWKHGAQRWFCLIVPLRTREQLAGAEAILPGHFPKIGDLLDAYEPHELATLTTLLRFLTRISMWRWDASTHAPKLATRLTLDAADTKRRRFPELDRGMRSTIQTRVVGDSSPERVVLRACGVESLDASDAFVQLKADTRWPKNFTLDPVTGRSEDALEKAEPHAAAIWTVRNGEAGQLRVRDTVFLPLSRGERERVACNGDKRFELLLHGLFFLDAGRRELYARDPEDHKRADEGLQETWNRYLLQRAVLPLVLPALKVFADAWSLSDSDVANVTAALSASRLFHEHRPELCQSNNWVKRVDFTEPTWELVDSDEAFLEIPVISGRVSTAANLFAALPRLCRTQIVVERGHPRLTRHEATAWVNAEPVLLELFESLNPQALTTADGLQLGAEFLSLLERDAPVRAIQVLAAKLRQLVAEHGVRVLDSVRVEFGSFLAKVPQRAWVGLGPLEKDAANVFRELNGLPLVHAVVPAELVPPEVAGDQLSLDEAETLFSWLKQAPGKRSAERTAAVALSVIAATRGARDQKLARLGEAPVLLARSGEAEVQVLSWRRLAELFEDGRLFAGGSTDLPLLQEALREQPLSLYEPKACNAFRILFDADSQRCTPAACVELLAAGPALKSAAHREPLFKRLLSTTEAIDEARRKTALRYLLHASAANIGDLESSLLTGESLASASVLSRVAQAALDREELGWLVVPDRLCRHVSDVARDSLGLRRVDGATLTELLKRASRGEGLGWVADLGLSIEEAEHVLLALTDRDVWRVTPLHCAADIRGDGAVRYVALTDGRCFLEAETGNTPFQRVAQRVTLLRRPSNINLLQAYTSAGVEPWGPHGCLAVATGCDDPHDLVDDMLDALSTLQGSLASPLLDRLRNTPWLPGPQSACAPVDVVDLPDVGAEIERVLDDPRVDNAFVCVSRLRVDWEHHRQALGVLRQRGILPGFADSLRLLAMCLGEIEPFRLGDITAVRERPARLVEISEMFRGCTGVSPALPFLDTLFVRFAEKRDQVADILTDGLVRASDVPSLRVNIARLCEKAARRQCGVESREYRVVCWLLETLSHHPAFRPSDLRDLTLRARDGSWQPAATLCVAAEGVPTRFLLDPELAALLPEDVRRPPRLSASVERDAAPAPQGASAPAEALIEFFEPWRGRVARPAVGGFLALLGDELSVKREAEASLHPRSVKSVRESINWEPIEGSVAVGADEDIHDMMGKQRFRVVIGEEGQPIRVYNLIGEEFEACVGGDVSSLFLGNLFFAPAEGRCKTLTVRRFDISTFTPRALTDILLESSRIVLRDVYCKQSTRIEALWRDLSEATQLQLEIVQDVILESAWVVLDQLGLRRMASIRPLARRREDLERRRAEARYEKSPESARAEIETQLLRLNQELRQLIETDETVQREMLEAVRAKMTEFEYSLESLGFELFQNADDAVAELCDMLGASFDSERVSRVCFELRTSDAVSTLTLVHWGRAINEFHRGTFSAEDGQRRGYDTDLKKMLLLSTSDKRERSAIVTGRFGLGFKTVFFATDQPRVLSGDLGFEVLGGLMPACLDDALRDQLLQLMLSRNATRRDGTVISLPLRVDGVEVEQALERFISLVPLMLVFARCVKRCEIMARGVEHEIRWTETEIVAPGVFFGRCISAGSQDALADGALVFRSGPSALLIALAPEGARRLPSAIPTFWVSAPTRSEDGVGVAVNGPFRVDVGRTQLACERDGSPLNENLQIAQGLGKALGRGLLALFDAIMTDWPNVRTQLGVLRELSAGDLWMTLWDVLIGAGSTENRLVRSIVWGEARGLQCVLEERTGLPTGLGHPYDGLTAIEQVRGVVDGVLDADETVLEAVTNWLAFRKTRQPGTLVSKSRIVVAIEGEPRGALDRLPRVTLEAAIREELAHVGVDPETATHLGKVVTRESLKAWGARNGLAEESELASIQALLREQRFRAANGDWVLARDLLIAEPEPAPADSSARDERRRWAFAPSDRVLHPDYSSAAIEFAHVCRGELNAPAEVLAAWSLACEDEARRRAALRYLLEGRLAAEVAHVVREQRDDTWVAELTRDELMSLGFDENEQLRLLALTGATGQDVAQMYLSPSVLPQATSAVHAGRVLQALASWWREHAECELVGHYARTYPDGMFPISARDDGDLDRAGWLRLFLLGCTRSMGPFTDEQHREFLRLCDERGWIEQLAQIERDRHAWLSCWDQYIDGQVDRIRYFHWMKNLLGLSVIARFLPEYVEAFLAVDRMAEGLTLDQVTSPRTSAAFSGGGPDAPPVGQIVGVGQCFIMRELVRHRLIRKPGAHRWCFVPLRQVRKLIGRLGGPEWGGQGHLWRFSAEIHAFLADHLEDATLNLGFDIPLRLVAERPDLWRVIVDQQPPEADLESDEEWR